MPAANDLNDHIAEAKGWTWSEERLSFVKGYDGAFSTAPRFNTNWRNPEGKPALRPDFTGTLEGVSGMLRELNARAGYRQYWVWGVNTKGLIDAPRDAYYCARHGTASHNMYLESFWSPPDCPGDCVGEAYMSVLGKEAADASAE